MHPLPSSAPSTVSVLVVDAGSTLGEFTGESTTHVLTALTSVRPRLVTEAKHEILHRTPELTDAVIAQVCERLLINRDQWPDPWPPSGFTPYPEATDVLAELARLAPVVTLSNLSITRQPSMVALHHQFAPHRAGTYTSYHLGARTPQARLWHRIADDFAVPVREIVHIGDRVDEDVTGPLHAGARAILISRRGYHPPPTRAADPDRAAVLASLSHIPDVITRWTR